MRKRLYVCAAVALVLFSFCSCSASVESSSTTSLASVEKTISSEILSSIQSAVKLSVDSYDCNVIVSEKDGKVDVSLSMSGGMIEWTFADCVYSATVSARKEMEQSEVALGELRVTFIIKKPGSQDSAMKWTSTDFDSGELVDLGDGPDDAPFIDTITLEKLMKKYDYTPPK